jgi:DNA modification methylase
MFFGIQRWIREDGKVNRSYPCPTCKAEITKRECERAWVTFFDRAINQEVTQAKQVPVMINYSVGRKRFEKEPEQFDLDLLKMIEESAIPYWFPTDRMPDGYNTEQPKRSHGITHVHHFCTKRNLWLLSCLYFKTINSLLFKNLLFVFQSVINRATKTNRFRWRGTGGLSGTLYVPSLVFERAVIPLFNNKLSDILKIYIEETIFARSCISEQSCTNVDLTKDKIDYIFTDPPFGGNLMYSELNFLWEVWLKVFTITKPEAIMNDTQRKGLDEYKDLMTACFKEMYRILKPNRWMTVVFHNSRASVWNAIQDAITRAGFIIAQVTVLDKQQGSFKQVTSSGAVKNDLVINAYKPKKFFEEHFLKRAGAGMEQEFVRDLLEHLPVEPNIERTEQMLYSRMLAHYVQRGFEISLNARQFYTLLRDNFKLIDGYWFTGSQVLKYEEWKKKHGLKGIRPGQQIAVVGDEKSAIAWLYNFLDEPKEYGEIYTASRKITAGVEDKIPELKDC